MGSAFSKEKKEGPQEVLGGGRTHWWKGFTRDEFDTANVFIEARKADPGKVSLFWFLLVVEFPAHKHCARAALAGER